MWRGVLPYCSLGGSRGSVRKSTDEEKRHCHNNVNAAYGYSAKKKLIASTHLKSMFQQDAELT